MKIALIAASTTVLISFILSIHFRDYKNLTDVNSNDSSEYFILIPNLLDKFLCFSSFKCNFENEKRDIII